MLPRRSYKTRLYLARQIIQKWFYIGESTNSFRSIDPILYSFGTLFQLVQSLDPIDIDWALGDRLDHDGSNTDILDYRSQELLDNFTVLQLGIQSS